MHALTRHVAAATVLVLALAGSALAAPPSTPRGQEQAPPGHEQTPPGQEKKAEEAATPAPAAAAAVAAQPGAKATPPGQETKAEQATAAAKTKTHGVHATTAGVKPSNTTSKNQWTTAGASPDVSKRYGNGQTAAQIATSRGAPGSTDIYGPGNSQPHKVCKKMNPSGKEVWVDVHAVKSYTASQCAPSTTTSTTTRNALAATPSSTASASASIPTSAAGGVAGVAASAPPAGGVAGVTAIAPAPAAGGVAGAFAEIGGVAAGTLPFTGLPLWAVVAIALAAIAVGTALVRRSRPLTAGDAV